MEIQVVTPRVLAYIRQHGLEKKWDKVRGLFEKDIRHPSLHTELMEPKEEMIFSFRIDRKYRALFVIKNNQALVFRVTNHYKK
jgi:plasmid maintenance system killer protein